MCIYICHNHTGFSSKSFVGGRIAKATAQYHACHLCSSEHEDQHLCILLCLPNSVHMCLQMYACIVQLEAIFQLQSEQYSMVYQSLCRILQLFVDGENEAVHVVRTWWQLQATWLPHITRISAYFLHTYVMYNVGCMLHVYACAHDDHAFSHTDLDTTCPTL